MKDMLWLFVHIALQVDAKQIKTVVTGFRKVDWDRRHFSYTPL